MKQPNSFSKLLRALRFHLILSAIGVLASLGNTGRPSSVLSGTTPVFARALTLVHAQIPTTFPILLPLRIYPEPPINVTARIIEATGEPELQSKSLAAALEPRVQPQLIEDVRAHEWITLAQLEGLGLTVDFDPALLELSLKIAPELRKTGTLSLRGSAHHEVDSDTLGPSPLSSFINFNFGQDFLSGGGSPDNGRQPLRSELAGAIRAFGTVLEANGSYLEKSNKPWTRGELRLVHDVPDRFARLTLGDLLYPVSGFQRFRSMGGVALTTHFDMQPYQVINPSPSRQIFLKRASTVRVFMNGRLMQTVALEAGPHNFENFPISSGTNNLTLEVEDDTGQVQRIEIPYFFSSTLLKPELHEVYYAIGIPSEQELNTRRYDPGSPTLSLSHRTGFSETLTAGGYFQGDHSDGLVGLTTTTVGFSGQWTLDAAHSRIYRADHMGYAARLGYVVSEQPNNRNFRPAQWSLGAGVEARTVRFGIPGEAQAPWRLNLALSRALTENLGLNLNASSDFFGEAPAPKNSYMLSAALNRTWRSGLNMTVTLNHARGSDTRTTTSGVTYLTWSFPQKNQSIHASANTENNTQRVQWTYNRGQNAVGDTALSAAVQHSDIDEQAEVRAEYTGNRARVGVTHHSVSSADFDQLTQRSGVRAGFALVTAGTHASLSRPVVDSFALVVPERNLAQHDISLNPRSQRRFEASSQGMGGAVLPELQSYRTALVRASLQDPRLELSLTQESFRILPAYRSGTLISLGTDSGVNVHGTLIDFEGQPIGLVSGEVRSETHFAQTSSSNGTPIAPLFFTNRAGRFLIEGLKSGHYEVFSFDDSFEPFTLDIPPGHTGKLAIGQVRSQKRSQQHLRLK